MATGTVIAQRIQMTALPQLVAAFHSLVGMAAVLVAFGAFLAPESYGIGTVGNINTASLVEMSIGLVIGAITFSGSVIAFAKLQGLMSGNPLVFPGQHALNAALGEAAGNALAIIDCERLAGQFGKAGWFDDRYWFMSKQAVALNALPLLASHTVAVLAAVLGLSRKCLVMDLDHRPYENQPPR